MEPEEKLAIVLEGLKADKTVTEVCKKHGISRDTYYRWHTELEEVVTEYWGQKKPGPKAQNEFDSRLEAEQAYKKQQAELKKKQQEIEELKKQVQSEALQKEFAEYQLELTKRLKSKKKSKLEKGNGS